MYPSLLINYYSSDKTNEKQNLVIQEVFLFTRKITADSQTFLKYKVYVHSSKKEEKNKDEFRPIKVYIVFKQK